MNVENAVSSRYSQASKARETELCCPVVYDAKYLDAIPDEIKERDYGCGNPADFVRDGDTVLDLGSGGGKICYIAAQIVGPHGCVIGVDMNDDMLSLAEKHRGPIGIELGYHNVEFRKGYIQDLRLDWRIADRYLADNPITCSGDHLRFEGVCQDLRRSSPLVADESIDVVLSNCVLNLVNPDHREQMFAEIFRVLKQGGRAAISDIVCDEQVNDSMRNDPLLWSGCISGAYREEEFLAAFERAGFHGLEIVKRDEKPWRTVEGIEFRAITVLAHKNKPGPCLEARQAVIYRGPWRRVFDDDGHVLERGQRMAVCDKTFQMYRRQPYVQDIIAVEPLGHVEGDGVTPFDCKPAKVRHPRETKGLDYDLTDGTDVLRQGENVCC